MYSLVNLGPLFLLLFSLDHVFTPKPKHGVVQWDKHGFRSFMTLGKLLKVSQP